MCKDVDDLIASVQAHLSVDQGPVFKYETLGKQTMAQKSYFAKVVAQKHTQQTLANAGVSPEDVAYKNTSKWAEIKNSVDRKVTNSRTWQAVVPEKVFTKIDNQMRQWDSYRQENFQPILDKIEAKFDKQIDAAKKDKAKVQKLMVQRNKELAPVITAMKKSYRQAISGRMKEHRQKLEEIYTKNPEDFDAIERDLKKAGFTTKGAHYTHEYFKHLENGGPYFDLNPGGGTSVGFKDLNGSIRDLTGNKVSFNLRIAALNIAEIAQKAPATFGFKKTSEGLASMAKAAKKSGVTIFGEIPEVKKAGYYNNDSTALRPLGKFDPVKRSQNLLDNASYYIGKAAGNIPKAMKEIAFRPDPWNDTIYMTDKGSKAYLDFMSFQFRHMQQYGGWVRDAINPKSSSDVRGKGAKALAIYGLMAGLTFGAKAAIPAPLYAGAKVIGAATGHDVDKELDDLSDNAGPLKSFVDGGLVGAATGGNVNLSTYAQPLGGLALGVGADMFNTAVDLSKNKGKIAKDIKEGRADKAAAIMANNLVQASQVFKTGASAGIQKATDAVVDAYIEDADLKGYMEHLRDNFAGKLKKAN